MAKPVDGWTAADIPDQGGQTIIVTGGASSLGLEIVRHLARKGASVVIACRNPERGNAAAADIGRTVPGADVTVGELDLASLASVRRFADWVDSADIGADVLINNAGLMSTPRAVTEDGFESQFGVNHLGHFALTGLLMDRLLASGGPRVVTVSSSGHKGANIDFTDLMGEKEYGPFKAYGQSKLANMVFTMELQRRFERAGHTHAKALAAHPGMTERGLDAASRAAAGSSTGQALGRIVLGRIKAVAMKGVERVGSMVAQEIPDAALPIVRAATDPAANGGDYFGPAKWLEYRGPAVKVEPHKGAHDVHDGRALWENSIQLTGVDYSGLREPTR